MVSISGSPSVNLIWLCSAIIIIYVVKFPVQPAADMTVTFYLSALWAVYLLATIASFIF